jgi:glycolate oxidase FAD binding subunit
MSDILHDWSQRIQRATSSKTPLRFRGGGTKDFYGQNLEGAVLDTRAYAGILSYEPSELVVTVCAGTPLKELEIALAAQGQCLPFEPPHFGEGATVGGMVAAGLSGPSRASVGNVRDFVLGAKMINGKGEQLTFGGQVMKNVAGYDISRLLAGSMGQLGLITELSLKVLPIAPGEATLQCAGLSQTQALACLHQWGGQPLPLNASAWLFDNTATSAQNYLFMRLRGAAAAVQAGVQRMTQEVQALGAEVVQMDNAQAAKDWRASNEHKLPFFLQAPSERDCLWRLSVPQTTPELELPYAQYVEWHGGQRWLWAPSSQALHLRNVAAQAGGHATLFKTSAAYGDADKRVGVFTPLSDVQQRIQNQLKQQFDPAGIFNPHRTALK